VIVLPHSFIRIVILGKICGGLAAMRGASGEPRNRHGRVGEGRRSVECQSGLFDGSFSGNFVRTEKFFEVSLRWRARGDVTFLSPEHPSRAREVRAARSASGHQRRFKRNRALPLLPRFRTYRCVASLGDQSAEARQGAAHGGELRQNAGAAASVARRQARRSQIHDSPRNQLNSRSIGDGEARSSRQRE
jgi:hypothetical protein